MPKSSIVFFLIMPKFSVCSFRRLTHQRYTVPQKHAESSISIPSLGLFDTNNPVYDPAEEEFRKQMQKKKKKRGSRLQMLILWCSM